MDPVKPATAEQLSGKVVCDALPGKPHAQHCHPGWCVNPRPAQPQAPARRHEGERADEKRGLYGKYIIQRVDGSDAPGGKHAGCQYFVLDLTHDNYALPALREYARWCRGQLPLLADDLDALRTGNKAFDLTAQAPAPSLDARGDLSEHELLAAGAASSCNQRLTPAFALRLCREVERRRAAPSAPSDALRRASEWLEAIQVRCREGDPKCNWLPKIDEFATNALSELMHVAATAVPSDALRESLGGLVAEWATRITACCERAEEAKTLGVQHCESYNQGQRYVYGSCAKAVSAALAASPSVTREQEWRSPECNYQLREILTLAWDHVNPIAAKFRKDILAAREHFAPLPAPTAPKEPQR